MINRANALKDLDRLLLKELTQTEIESKYEMPVTALIELTEWKAHSMQTQIPTATLNTETAVVIDVNTKDGQRKLAAQAVTAIIELLSPLDEHQQARVLESVGAYFGVIVGT